MTSSRMGRLYIKEAASRVELVRLALERRLWARVGDRTARDIVGRGEPSLAGLVDARGTA